MIWPSGCPQRDPAATKATPAPFSMISIEIRIKSEVTAHQQSGQTQREQDSRQNQSMSPSEFASSSSLRSSVGAGRPEMASAHQRAQQQHGSQFHANQIRTIERDRHLFRTHNAAYRARRPGADDQIDHFSEQDGGENGRTDPYLP